MKKVRDLNRIDNFVDKFANLWKGTVPDWRFGQLVMNFFGWVSHTKGIDPFFPEEDRMLTYFKEYCDTLRLR